ncbi:K+ channel tetramerisation domain protein [Ancylostoma ceylanicum]|uniref:K+ channel tetramerisation domain protein n=1 Tax=Ancylostoma ceylanicum TaxID=53326 RepID=A0A0D6LFB2_9BILA|nr:K+ channel tetramerisation domain protein [Ancylostoma ceylanicum]
MSELNRRVRLNVGGQTFETTIGTLRRVADTTLAKLVENTSELSQEPIFIDHDPKYFSSVLNFLRDGRIPLPDNIQDIDELRREAQYFNLPSLTDFIECEEQRGPPFFRGDKVVWRVYYSVLPAIKDEVKICGLCGTSSDSFDRNYRTLFELPRNATFAVGDVKKVYRDSCCVDVTFAMFNYLYHIPAKMLQLVGSGYTSAEE